MKFRTLATLVCLSVAAMPAMSQPKESGQPAKPTAPAKADKRVGDPYPLATCPISGKKLGEMGVPVTRLYEGREVKFCCDQCPSSFEKDLAASMAKVDAAIVKDQAPLYPLDTSVVTGKKLPEKGAVDLVYGNRLVRLGADSEKAEFLKEPAKYIETLDKAVIAAQEKTYTLKKCPVSDEDLGSMGKPKDIVLGGRLIKLCCKSCVKDAMKDPAKYIAQVDEARKAKK
ncbi:hypothetical protein PHYC_02128 [Phycisphaerales bacterium]|nr:hypothetical protein PHYC_02128 [Phycisphaerales bacterium]